MEISYINRYALFVCIWSAAHGELCDEVWFLWELFEGFKFLSLGRWKLKYTVRLDPSLP